MVLFFLIQTGHFALPLFWMFGLGFLVLHCPSCVRITTLCWFLILQVFLQVYRLLDLGYVDSHNSFLDLVRSVWSFSIPNSGTGVLLYKLKLLKVALRR